MLGKPKFKLGDEVEFDLDYDEKTYTCKGKIEIIDAYGTFFDNSDVSYDVMCEESPLGKCFFKHISEKIIRKVERTEENED